MGDTLVRLVSRVLIPGRLTPIIQKPSPPLQLRGTSMPMLDLLLRPLRTSVHIQDDEDDRCTCPNCLEDARRAKDKDESPDKILKPPRYDLFEQ